MDIFDLISRWSVIEVKIYPWMTVLPKRGKGFQGLCWSNSFSSGGGIPVTVVSIPVVVFPSISTFSLVNATSSINRVFCRVHTHSAFSTASFVSSSSAAKRIFHSWGFQTWHNSQLTVSTSFPGVIWKVDIKLLPRFTSDQSKIN